MVVVVDTGVNGLFQSRDAAEFFQLEASGFKHAEKAFSYCVIEAVALSRHALHHACRPEPVLISRHLVLPALVSVQHGRITRRQPCKYFIQHRINSAITCLSDRLYARSGRAGIHEQNPGRGAGDP